MLCAAHRIVLQEAAADPRTNSVVAGAIDELLTKGRVTKKTIERAVAEVMAGLGGVFGVFAPPPGMRLPPNMRDRMNLPPRPPPPIDLAAERKRRELAKARAVLGFGPAEMVTAETIKARKRELAKQHHPDRGGSPSAMAAVNDAADVLLAAV